MERVPGKTISQLSVLTYVTGKELLPISVFSKDKNAYMTYAVDIDTFLTMLNNRMKELEQKSAAAYTYIQDRLTYLNDNTDTLFTYDLEKTSYINKLQEEDKLINSYIKTIYHQNSDDAFDEYREGDGEYGTGADDYVTWQGEN